MLRRALTIRARIHGEEHADVDASLNRLAALYDSEGRFDEVEPLLVRSIEIRKKALGTDDPLVATAMNNLGVLYHKQGKLAEAEKIIKLAGEIREKHFGLQHLDTDNNISSLARVYRDQDRLSEAEGAVCPLTCDSREPSITRESNGFASGHRAEGFGRGASGPGEI